MAAGVNRLNKCYVRTGLRLRFGRFARVSTCLLVPRLVIGGGTSRILPHPPPSRDASLRLISSSIGNKTSRFLIYVAFRVMNYMKHLIEDKLRRIISSEEIFLSMKMQATDLFLFITLSAMKNKKKKIRGRVSCLKVITKNEHFVRSDNKTRIIR